jgi:hypothetical protein
VSIQVEELDDRHLSAIRALPGVRIAAVRGTIFLRPSGTDLKPFVDFFAVSSADGVSGYDLVRPRVDEGRLPSPDASDEVFLTTTIAERLGATIGDRISVDTLTMDAVFASFESGVVPPPDGPTVDVTVTGVGVIGAELLAPEQVPNGSMFFPPAFLERHQEVAAFTDLVDIELTGGPAAVDRFVADARAELGSENVFIIPVAQELEQVRDGVDLQRSALLLFLAVTALAGTVAMVQAANRAGDRHDADLDTLGAIGLDARHRVAAVVGLFVPAVLVGAILGAGFAVLASRWLPFGLAGRLEPDPGFDVDWVIVPLGAVVAATIALAAITASAALTDHRRGRTTTRTEPALVAAVAARSRPAVSIGVRWALLPGQGRQATPVRSALFGTVIGLGGALAALSFGTSLDRLIETPARHGVNYDLVVSPFGDETDDTDGLSAATEVAARDDVAAVSLIRTSKLSFHGETHDAFGLEAARGGIGYSLIEGRPPAADAEVVLGDALLDELDLQVGDPLVLEGGQRQLTIVGRALFPPLDDANSLATGLGFTLAGLAAALDDIGDADSSSGFPLLLVDVAPGLPVEVVRDTMSAELGDVRVATRPTSVGNLSEAQDVPIVLAAFLGLLGLLALANTVIASAVRRRADLAILRCLGFERRDVAATVRAHSATIVAVGLLGGLPIGAALGRWSWRLVARGAGVGDDPAGLAAAVAIVVATAAALGILLALPSGRSAARTRPAVVLRAE